ncbi:efflux RND transporter permease subunit [Telmatocola sphagniphila]|uniref:Efflux RND transporter permease subunit n=1 Tax=Telmatocola sphagniphila TaxID=1123043 RepID=A0A8E6B2Y5_9BACT|nr:efflux RND transporter permease subunit [Telmatocola sphagniphila]QVL30126.1 efflux RND transporter permease subunit [Telmatocola sphagniphila]
MWIVRLALRRTYTFLVLAVLIAVMGAVSARKMSTDIFPEIDIPVVTVVWSYQGMPAEEIESRIILVTERVLTASVNDIEHIESQSLNGVGVIRIFFQQGAKIEAATAQVTATCQTLLVTMPPGIQPPFIVRYSATSVPILQVAVSSDTLNEQQIFDYAANFVIQRLGTVQGARVPQPYGGKPRQIMIDLDLDALYSRGLSPQDVSTAVTNQNLIIPAGTAKIGDTEYNVRLNSSPDLVDQFNFLPIRTVNGVPIYLKNVAEVRDGFAVQTNVVRRDGHRAVLMTILKGEGASTLDVVRNVKAALPGIQDQLPPELKLDLLFDQSVFVSAAVNGVLKEGAIAAGLTALMILLFLGSWRSTLIVAISIPLSILVSISCLWAFGYTLNIMTLGGMSLAVGILVDDATVEIENVHRNLGMKKELRHAILDGAAQIAVPAFVATLSICIVFIPILFLTGTVAFLFIPLALAVVFAMLASYLLSRTLIPTLVLFLLPEEAKLYAEGHEGHASGGRGPIWWMHRIFNNLFERFRSTYQRALAWCLQNRAMTVVGMMGFALGTFLLEPLIGRDFFPTVDAGQFRLHVRAPAGTRIEETERIFGQVEEAIRKIVPDEERELILDNMGLSSFLTPIAYNDNGTVSAADGEIFVALKPVHAPVAQYLKKLREELPKQFPDVIFYFQPADIVGQVLNFGKPAPFNIQVVGVSREANLAIAQKLKTEIAAIPGMVDVHIHQVTDSPDLRIDVDRILANEMMITQSDVARSILVSLSSTSQTSPNFWVNPSNRVNYRVAVQTPQSRIDSLQSLMNTPVTIPEQSAPQLLANLADVRRATSAAVVNHYNIQTVYEVYANVQGRDLESAQREVEKVLARTRPELPRGSTIAVRGQIESMNDSFQGLAGGLLFAILLVYLLMVVNFQSWIDPFIILTALPGALAGILWALFATHTDVSVPALMGAIMCVGVATSNSILMVTFANDKRIEGLSAIDAAFAAGSTRLRPVVMTATAMIIGMLPMSLGLSEGGEQNAPLGRAVIGGLLVATAFTLLFVPVTYSLLRRTAPVPPIE